MTTSDCRVSLDQGDIFIRSWKPDRPNSEESPTFILFHDSLGCVELWRDFPELLVQSTGLSVVAYDRLGFGRSAPNPDRLKPDFISQEARVVFPKIQSEIGLGLFIPLGHSVGGAMAIETASQFPQSCQAVVAISAQTLVEEHTLIGIKKAKKSFETPAQLERLSRYHGSKSPWVLASWVETWLAPSFLNWTLEPALKSLNCPLLAIYGEDDEYCSDIHPNRIKTLSGGPATVESLPHCGHLPHRERAKDVLTEIASFVGSLRLAT